MLTMAEAPSFFASVYALVAQIPPGFVASYGQLARMLGAPRSWFEQAMTMSAS